MREFLTVEDIRWNKGWRDEEEERKARESARRKREIEKERERVACVAAEKQQPAATNNLAAWVDLIDERVRGWFDYYFSGQSDGNDRRGFYADWIAKGIADLRRQLRGEFKDAIEEQQRAFEAKLVALEQHLASNNGRIEATLAHERDVLSEVTGGVRAHRDEIRHAFGEMCDAFGTQIAALEQRFEQRVKAVPGKLPVVKLWQPDSVIYEAQVVSYDGSLWQARKDTAQVPGGSDWVCIARGGRDGLSLSIRGAFNVYKKYAQLDVVTFDGASFVAKRNSPGICPGDGWQMLAPRGKAGDRGPPGSRGTKGEKGAKGDAPEIVSWHLERKTYRAFPVYGDGKMGPELNLRPLFEQFVAETGYAAA